MRTFLLGVALALYAALAFAAATVPANADVPTDWAQGKCGTSASSFACSYKCGVNKDKTCWVVCSEGSCDLWIVGLKAAASNPGDGSPPAPVTVTPGYSFPLTFYNPGRVQSACEKVPGAEFVGGKARYACVNASCTTTGPCVIACVDRLCAALMPDQPGKGITLVGILQNNSNVVKGHPTTPGSEVGGSGRGQGVILF